MAADHLVHRFSEALRCIDSPGATGTDLMIKCRKLLEATNNKNKYPVAWLFSNWVAHPELERDKAAAEILEQLNQFVVGLLGGSGCGPFGQEVTRKLKLENLRLDLVAICAAFGVSDSQLNNETSWSKIRDMLLNDICESPITASERTVQMLLKQHPTAQWVVTGIVITNDFETLNKFPVDRPYAFVIDVREVSNISAEPRRLISQIVD
jgi:hypothetical protein